MTRVVVSDQQAGFAGGLNSVSDPAFLRPDQARQMANFRLSNYGAALKRLGTQLTTAAPMTTYQSAGSLYGGIYWPSKAQIFAFLAGTNTTAVHVHRTTYPSAFPATWTDKVAIPQFRPVIFSDGTTEVMYVAGDPNTAVYKYDGDVTATALGAGTAMVRGLCVYNDRLWGWQNNHLYYSNLSSAVGSTGGDSIGDAGADGGEIIVRTFGASDIVACAPVNGSLLIWHERGISVLTGWGQDDVQVQPQALNAAIGMGHANPDGLCVANTSSEGDVAYFITDLGMYVSNGGYVRPMGTPDKPDPIAPLLLSHTIDPYDVLVRFNRQFNEIWVVIKDTVTNTGGSVYVYNVILGAWSGPYTGTYTSGTQAMWEVVDDKTTFTTRLWRLTVDGAAGSGTYVSECDRAGVYTDDTTSAGTGGTAVTATLQLHRMFCGDRMYAKSFRWLNLLATLTSGATPPVITTTTPVAGTNTNILSDLTAVEQPYYVSPGGTGAYIDVTITDAGSTGASQYAMASVQGNMLGQR